MHTAWCWDLTTHRAYPVVGHIIQTAADQHLTVTVVAEFHTHQVVVKLKVQLLHTPVCVNEVLESDTLTHHIDLGTQEIGLVPVNDLTSGDSAAVV